MKLIKQLDLFPTGANLKGDLAQHNFLVYAHFNMGMIETRLFVSMLSRINKYDTEFTNLLIPVSEIIPNNDGKSYAQLKEACKNLTGFKVNLRDQEDKSFDYIVLITRSTHNVGTGFVSTTFNPEAKEYLLQLKGNFTTAQHYQLLRLHSPYAARFYWILKSLYKKDRITMSVERIKSLLFGEKGVSQYEKYGMFKKRIILPVQQELKETDCPFTFVENKEKLTVVSLTFIVNNIDVSPKELANPLYEQLVDLGISPKSIPKIDELLQAGEVTIPYIEYVIEAIEKDTKIKSPAGALYKAIIEKHLWADFLAQQKKQHSSRRSSAHPAAQSSLHYQVITTGEAEAMYAQEKAAGKTKYPLSGFIKALKTGRNIVVEGYAY